jgi:hypothetical protein
MALVLFCALVRGFIDSLFIPSTVLYASIGYAVLVLCSCSTDLARSSSRTRRRCLGT